MSTASTCIFVIKLLGIWMEEEKKVETEPSSKASDSTPAKPGAGIKKPAYGVLAAIIVLIVLGSLWAVGRKSIFKGAQASPSPSASPSVSPSPSPSPFVSPKASPKASPTPTPTPTPSPTPSPSPSPVGFMVTSVAASVAPTSSTTCPQTFNFSGVINANGAGTVTYKWERSDGAGAPTESVTFSGAGSQTVSDTWTIGGTYSGWEKVKILTPNSTESNQANFTISCP